MVNNGMDQPSTLSATFTKRSFVQPLDRRPIRADFPNIASLHGEVGSLVSTVQRQLAKRHVDWDKVDHISIAYPHKHPIQNPEHKNKALAVAKHAQRKLQAAAPHIDWILADALYERTHLARSENQGIVYSLTRKHDFGIDPQLQTQALPFLQANDNAPEYFILIDQDYETGTTLANLTSFIEANGGTVLAAGVDHVWNDSWDLAQRRDYKPLLAQKFAAAAQAEGLPYGPDECMTLFDNALARHHLSLEALTDLECAYLNLIGHPRAITFGGLLQEMQETPPASAPAPI